MESRYNIKKEMEIKTSIYFNPTEIHNLDDIKTILENDASIRVYPNSEDESESIDNNYKNVTDYIYRIFDKSRVLCKGIGSQYLIESFNRNDAVVVIGSSMDILPNGNVFGFAGLKFDQTENSLYIDIICSHSGIKGAGDFLIKKLEDICRNLSIDKIHLKSVEWAISFYEKYGYIKQDTSCVDDCLMIKTIRKKIGGKKRKSRKFKKTKKYRKSRKTK
jgi:hypothetical protein